jgi:Ca2+-binding RTX toxin-like protein
MPTFFVAAAAGAALLASLLPSTAAAADPSRVWIDGKTLYFDAADRTVNAVSVEPYPLSGYVLVRDAGGTPIRSVDPCVALAPNLVRCPLGGVVEMVTVLRGEDDQFHGGPWKDVVYGGPENDEIWGGKGNDELHGGTGEDRLDGETGTDEAYGDPDKDTCVAEYTEDCE